MNIQPLKEARVYKGIGENELSKTKYQEFLIHHPNNIQVKYEFAELLLELEEYLKAKKILKDIIENPKTNVVISPNSG